MIEDGKTNIVAFKQANPGEANKFLEYEKNMYELIGEHGKPINFRKKLNQVLISTKFKFQTI